MPPRSLKEFSNSNCTRCPLHTSCKSVCIPGYGNISSPVVFIGEAPGATEDSENKPFVGRAGKHLNSTLLKLGIKREDVFVTNIVRCRPPENRPPSTEEINACLPYLRKELEFLKPKLLVALGNTALNALTHYQYNIGGYRRTRATLSFAGIPLTATYHPSAAMRNGYFDAQMQNDVWAIANKKILKTDIKEVHQKI